MGKQINYWMDCRSFLLLAQRAVELGCTIVREDSASGRVLTSRDLSMVDPDHRQYYFHLPEAGDLAVGQKNGREYLNLGFTAGGNTVIEAGFSFFLDEPEGTGSSRRRREIRRARLYCISGYYDEKGAYLPRPACLTKVYNALARYVKRLAPCTEFVETRISTREETYGEPYEYRHKEYITPACLDLVRFEGYKLC